MVRHVVDGETEGWGIEIFIVCKKGEDEAGWN
jgi:hypothetical protein